MKKILLAIFLLVVTAVNAQIEKVIPQPKSPPQLVNDFAEFLTPEQELSLENKLRAYVDSTSSQIAVVTLQSLQGYEDEEVALAIGRSWGVGGSQFNNGIVILISRDERAARIEVGYGLEGAIPDITAKTIIENDIIPNFRQGNYYRGLDQATDDIFKAAAGEYKGSPKQGQGKGTGLGFGVILLILLIVFFTAGRGGGRGGGGMISRRGYRDISTGWILGTLLGGGRGSSGGGWSGGGGSSGGFGGFGGGGFGGGGASGNW